MKLPTGFQLIGQVVRILASVARDALAAQRVGTKRGETPAAAGRGLGRCSSPPGSNQTSPVDSSGPPRLHQVAHTLLRQETRPSRRTHHLPILRQVRSSPGGVRRKRPGSDWHQERLKVTACVLTRRVGLMGNPSDGFNGKTVAMSISNFWAEVTLVESQTLVTCTFPNQSHFCPPPASELLYLACFFFAGSAPSPTQRPHRVWKPAGFVLHQQERRVRARRAGAHEEEDSLLALLTVLSLAPPAGTWEGCGCCRPPARSSISSAPNKGGKHRPVLTSACSARVCK